MWWCMKCPNPQSNENEPRDVACIPFIENLGLVHMRGGRAGANPCCQVKANGGPGGCHLHDVCKWAWRPSLATRVEKRQAPIHHDTYKVTNVVKCRSFQFCLLRRAIVANIHLIHWKIINSDLCIMRVLGWETILISLLIVSNLKKFNCN